MLNSILNRLERVINTSDNPVLYVALLGVAAAIVYSCLVPKTIKVKNKVQNLKPRRFKKYQMNNASTDNSPVDDTSTDTPIDDSAEDVVVNQPPTENESSVSEEHGE